jgi:type II secretion system protein H
MRKCTNGFTLIELIVVVLILTLSLTVVFPKINSMDQKSLLRSCVNRIASFAEYAHQRAACTRLIHILHIDIEKGKYWINSQDSDGQEIPITDALNLKGRLPKEVKFIDIKFHDNKINSQDIIAIMFSPQGWADPATILLACSTGETMSVIIEEFSGRVETCEIEGIN